MLDSSIYALCSTASCFRLQLMSPLQVELFQLTPPADIILPSWSVPLYQSDGSLRETAITRHTNVLGYPVPEDTCAVSLLL